LRLALRGQVGILAAPDVVDGHARLDIPRRELVEEVAVAVDAELRRQQPVKALAEAYLAADELTEHAGPPAGRRRSGGSPCRSPILPEGARDTKRPWKARPWRGSVLVDDGPVHQ